MALLPLDDRERHQFADEGDVERFFVAALRRGDWEWLAEVREDAAIFFAHTIARLDRKFGCGEELVARMVAERRRQEVSRCASGGGCDATLPDTGSSTEA